MSPDTLRGTVERITYHNEENGYTVAQLLPAGQAFTVTVIGNMLGLNVGESVSLDGAWSAHPQYGRQFKVERMRTLLPATVAGLERYLASGLIKGVGPVTAQRIVRAFGLDTLRIIEEEPRRLYEVSGVGARRAETILQAWAQQKKIKEVMIFLQGHNVSTGLAVRIYKQYGDDAIAIVQENPYRLAREVFGIGFLTADKIARELGTSPDAPQRIAAGILYALSQAADEGHVYLPMAELSRRACEILGVSHSHTNESLLELRQGEDVNVETAGPLGEAGAVYLAPFYRAEVGVAGRLRRLAGPASGLFAEPNARYASATPQEHALTERQLEAVDAALGSPLTVLTGGPGTGKTTTVRTMIDRAEALGLRVVLASPTGRAAKRLSEATGRPAKTLHRLLEFKPAEGMAFQRNEANPIEADLVIVDEASMLDLLLANHLLKAVPGGARLVLVGDVDQLPSVGAGNVLHDVIVAIEANAGLPGRVVRLDTIFRQPEGSYIITNAHRINHGQMPVLDDRDARDFFLFKIEDPEKAAEMVVDLVQNRMPRRFGIEPADIQVLSPMHRGAAGVAALNERLQAALNPPAPGKPERMAGGRAFRVGDRVMQIRNNYDKDVFNGDMGHIVAIDLEEQTVAVRIDDRDVIYDFIELDELVHAYAVSIHKAQGSEFRAIVVPLLTSHYVMLQRNLIYTAVTRARSAVVLVGTNRAIAIAVKNDRAQGRYSGLVERLTGRQG